MSTKDVVTGLSKRLIKGGPFIFALRGLYLSMYHVGFAV